MQAALVDCLRTCGEYDRTSLVFQRAVGEFVQRDDHDIVFQRGLRDAVHGAMEVAEPKLSRFELAFKIARFMTEARAAPRLKLSAARPVVLARPRARTSRDVRQKTM